MLIQLYWLPVLLRMNFKILLLLLLLLFLHGLAPSYISDLIRVKPVSSRYSLRSADGILWSEPKCKALITLGDRAFVSSAPKMWNALPHKNGKTVDCFKKLLKTEVVKFA